FAPAWFVATLIRMGKTRQLGLVMPAHRMAFLLGAVLYLINETKGLCPSAVVVFSVQIYKCSFSFFQIAILISISTSFYVLFDLTIFWNRCAAISTRANVTLGPNGAMNQTA